MPDVTASVARLGNPAGSFNGSWTYARNAWDLQAFGGKLYIGAGNSANTGTDPNAGPLPVLVYEPGVGFSTQQVGGSDFQTEQIDRFLLLDGALVTLCHDPVGTDYPEWWSESAGTWTSHKDTAVNAIHTYDIHAFGGDHFLAVGNATGTSQFNISTDGGATWAPVNTVGDTNRGQRFFEHGGSLYGVSQWTTTGLGFRNQGLWKWNGTSFSILTHAMADVMPSTTLTGITKAGLNRIEAFAGSIVYVGHQVDNDHQWIPLGLYATDDPDDTAGSQRLSLPNSALPYDVLVVGSTLCVLGAHTSGSDTVVGVYATTDLSTWTELFTFTPNDVSTGSQGQTFARSFERIGAVWYFGLGSNTGTQPANVGDILAYDTGADWPQVGGNPQHTSFQATEMLMPPFSLAWRFQFHVALDPPEKLYPQVNAVVSAGHVLMPTLQGNLHSIEAGPSGGSLEWSAYVGAPVMGSVAADGTNVYVADIWGRVSAFKLADGTAASGWTNPVQVTNGLPIQSSVLLADSKIIVAGADGTLYARSLSNGSAVWSRPLGTRLLQTPAWSDATGTGLVIVAGADMRVRAINSATGAVVWTSQVLAGGAFRDYWPVIHEASQKVIIRPWPNLVETYLAPTTPIRSLEVSDWSDDSAMQAVLDAYVAAPEDYSLSLHVLDLNDGSYDASNQIIHWHHKTVINGANWVGSLDASDNLVIAAVAPPSFDGAHSSGWVQVDLSTRKVVAGLIQPGDMVGWGNYDENMATSACANAVTGFHYNEGNAQDTGIFTTADETWYLTEYAAGTDVMSVATEAGGTNPAAISDGLILHNCHPHTLVAIKGS